MTNAEERFPPTAHRRPHRPARLRPNLTALILVLALPCLLVATEPDTQNTEVLPENLQSSGEEFSGKVFLSAVGGVLTGALAGIAVAQVDRLATREGPEHTILFGLSPGLLGAWCVYPLGCAAGAWAAGLNSPLEGRFLPTLGVTYGTCAAATLVSLGGLGLMRLNAGSMWSGFGLMIYSAGFIAGLMATPPLAASSSNRHPVQKNPARLDPGGLRIGNQSLADGSKYTTLDLRLINVRF